MLKLKFLTFRTRYLIYIQLFVVCVLLFFITEFGLPESLIYISDIITCLAAIFAVLARVKLLKTNKLNYIDIAFILLFGYAIFTSVATEVGLFSALWAIRTTFRFYIFYYCCVALLGRNDVFSLLRMLEILFSVNAVLVFFEYFIQGMSGDYLGGIFGIQKGGNGYLNIYIIIMLSYEISRFLEKNLNSLILAYYLAVSFVIASFAEIKFLFFEIVVLIIGALLMRYPTKKTISLSIVFFFLLLAGLQVLKMAFPESYIMLFSAEDTNDYLDATWTGGHEMGRTNAIQFINNSFFASRSIYECYGVGFGDYLINQLFGLGFGSAEPSDFVHSAFADQYSDTNYAAFEYADRYLEMGWIGLCLYIAFFAIIFIYTFKAKRNNDSYYNIWLGAVRLFVPVLLMNMLYGNFRTGASYLIFFFLAVPRIMSKN